MYLWQFAVLHLLRMGRVGFGCPHLESSPRKESLRALQVEMDVAPECLQLETM
jgi:hypothetical protein